MISVHEEGRWPFTGALADHAGGSAFNLPVPKGYNDTEAHAVLEGLILPRTAEFSPDAVVLQCGADSLTEDPLSRLTLSNRAYIRALRAIWPLSPRLLVLGGGGYNPWTLARAWSGIWARLTGQEIPDRLPAEAEALLRGLDCDLVEDEDRPDRWFTTLADPVRGGPVRPEFHAIARAIRAPADAAA